MYNGIGITTPKGSGTNGYVQRNLAHVKHTRIDFNELNKSFKAEPIKVKKANPELLLHEQKRKVEIELIKLEDELRSAGMHDWEIENNIARERVAMTRAVEDGSLRYDSELEKKDSHQLAHEKERELAKFEKALRIDRGAHVDGAAFDQDLQAKLKLERMQQRAEQEHAKLEAAKRAEKAQRKAEKLRAKAAKAKKKAEEKLSKLREKQARKLLKKEGKAKTKREEVKEEMKANKKRKDNKSSNSDSSDITSSENSDSSDSDSSSSSSSCSSSVSGAEMKTKRMPKQKSSNGGLKSEGAENEDAGKAKNIVVGEAHNKGREAEDKGARKEGRSRSPRRRAHSRVRGGRDQDRRCEDQRRQILDEEDAKRRRSEEQEAEVRRIKAEAKERQRKKEAEIEERRRKEEEQTRRDEERRRKERDEIDRTLEEQEAALRRMKEDGRIKDDDGGRRRRVDETVNEDLKVIKGRAVVDPYGGGIHDDCKKKAGKLKKTQADSKVLEKGSRSNGTGSTSNELRSKVMEKGGKVVVAKKSVGSLSGKTAAEKALAPSSGGNSKAPAKKTRTADIGVAGSPPAVSKAQIDKSEKGSAIGSGSTTDRKASSEKARTKDLKALGRGPKREALLDARHEVATGEPSTAKRSRLEEGNSARKCRSRSCSSQSRSGSSDQQDRRLSAAAAATKAGTVSKRR